MAKYTIEKIKQMDDPMRCQAVNNWGQCYNKALVLGGNCPVHGGNKTLAKVEAAKRRLYKLTKYRSRLNEMDSPNQEVKGLREEIGILRIIMEEVVNNCDGPVDILAHAPKISDIAVKIGKLVASCHSIEKSLGQYMDKAMLVQKAQEIVQVIAGVITDPRQLDTIIQGIEAVLNDETGQDD